MFCTNLRGARVAAALEAETGIPIYDTVATGLWQGLRLAGADPRRISGLGAAVRARPGRHGRRALSEASEWPEGTGVVPLEQVRGMSGLEFLSAIAEGRLPAPPIGATLGFRLVEVAEGRAVFAGAPQRAHYNPIGSVHGGWALTLLDSCTACAVHSTLAAGQGYISIETKVNFTRPLSADLGPLRAEGRVISVGRRIGTAEGRLTGADGRVYAHGTSTCLIFAL